MVSFAPIWYLVDTINYF